MAPVWAEALGGLTDHDGDYEPLCELGENDQVRRAMAYLGCFACVISMHAHAARTPGRIVQAYEPSGKKVAFTAAEHVNSLIAERGLPLPTIPLPS